MNVEGNETRATARGAAHRRTRRRLLRARARLASRPRRGDEQEPVAFADPFFVDPFCLLSPR